MRPRHRNLPSPRNLDLQLARIKHQFPSFGRSTPSRTSRRVVGTLQPTPVSNTYTVEIRFSVDAPPQVWVLSPELPLHPSAKRLPHVYLEGNLCLYTFDQGDFQRYSDYIADTIIPWTIEWLAHYEIWFATGVWYGDAEASASPHDAIKSAPSGEVSVNA